MKTLMRINGLLLLGLAMLVGTAQAQEPLLEVVYTSPAGMQPPRFFDIDYADGVIPSWPGRGDADGDGREDLVMIRRNAQGHIDGVRVLDFNTGDELWRTEADTEDEFAGLEFVGFVKLFDDGSVRHALFTGETSSRLMKLENVTMDQIWETDVDWYQLVAVRDLTGNRLHNLVFYRPETKQVEVWGAPD